MSISIYNSSGIINIIQSLSVPRSYFQCSGSAKAIGSDYVQIQIDKDTYDLLWSELDIDGNTPESQYAALYMLAQVFANVPVIPPAPPTNLSLTIAPNANFDIPAYTGNIPIDSDFTIEWGAKMTADDNHPRAWSIGSFPDAAHAVSIENGTLYYWIGGVNVKNVTVTNHIGNWTYFTIMRVTTFIYIFQDGIQITSLGFTDAIPTNGLPLYLGSEGNDSLQNGLMSNFRWNNTSVYNTGGFTPPSVPLTSVSGTQLLIFQGNTLPLEITDNSGLGNIVTNGTGIYNADSPFAGYQGSIQFGTI